MLKALQALLAHNHNQQQAMQRAVQAKAQGLDPEVYGTVFPGSVVTTNTTNNNNTGSGYLKGSLLTAALLAAGGTGSYLISKPVADVKQVAPVTPVVSNTKTKTTEYDAVYEELQPDGTWKQVKRERLKPGSIATTEKSK